MPRPNWLLKEEIAPPVKLMLPSLLTETTFDNSPGPVYTPLALMATLVAVIDEPMPSAAIPWLPGAVLVLLTDPPVSWICPPPLASAPYLPAPVVTVVPLVVIFDPAPVARKPLALRSEEHSLNSSH